MLNKYVKRTLDIIGISIKDKVEDNYISNFIELKNEADEIKENLTKKREDVTETLSSIKNGSITKRINDWFFAVESEYDQATGDGDDEFDAGFKISDSDDMDQNEKVRELTPDVMGNISDKQTSMMVKIGHKQAEQSVSNTAEVVSTINTRSSEIIASMSKINDTLININEQLKNVVTVVASTVQRDEEKNVDKKQLYRDGKISLSGMVDAAANSVTENTVIQSLQTAFNLFKQGTPDQLFGMLVLDNLTNKKIGALGNKSIDEIGTKLNETIEIGVQSALSSLISSDTFKKIFGDNFGGFSANENYGRFITNKYTTDKATFDNMTRWSIISVIPELLSNINQTLGGTTYHVDANGRLIAGQKQNEFRKVVDTISSGGNGLTEKSIDNIQSFAKKQMNVDVNNDHIDLASEALMNTIAIYMVQEGKHFTNNDAKNIDRFIVATASMLTKTGIGNPQYWSHLLQIITFQIKSSGMQMMKFVTNMNKVVDQMRDEAKQFAEADTIFSEQATVIDSDMIANRFLERHKDDNKSFIHYGASSIEVNREYEKQNNPIKEEKKEIVSKVDGNLDDKKSFTTKYTNNDYLRGIFSILNRGINVKAVDSVTDMTDGFQDYRQELDKQVVSTQGSSSGKFGKQILDAIQNGGKIKSDDELFSDIIAKAMSGEDTSIQNNSSSSSNSAIGNFLGSFLAPITSSSVSKTINELANGTFSIDEKITSAKEKLNNTKNNFIREGSNIADYGKAAYTKSTGKVNEFIDSHKNLAGIKSGIINVGSKAKTKVENMVDPDNIKESYDNFISADVNKPRSLLGRSLQTIKSKYYGGSAIRSNRQLRSIFENADLTQRDIDLYNQYVDARKNKSTLQQLNDISSNVVNGDLFVGMRSNAKLNARATGYDTTIKALTGSDGTNRILALVKWGFNKVIKGISTVTKSIVNLGKSGIADIIGGAKVLNQGLFGTREKLDANGNVETEARQGLLTLPLNGLKGLKNIAFGDKNFDENERLREEAGQNPSLLTKARTFINDTAQTVSGGINKYANFFAYSTSLNNDKSLDYQQKKDLRKEYLDVGAKNFSSVDLIRRGVFGSAVDFTRDAGNIAGNTFDAVSDSFKNKLSELNEKLSKSGGFYEKVNKGLESFGEGLGKVIAPLKNFKDNLLGKKNEETGKREGGVFEKVRNSKAGQVVGSFASGFSEAKKESDKIKAAMQEKQERASSFINRTTGDILDILKGDQPSVLKQLADILNDEIDRNKEKDAKEEKENEKSNNENSSNTTPSTPETTTTENNTSSSGGGIGSNIKNFFSKNKGTSAAAEAVGGAGKSGVAGAVSKVASSTAAGGFFNKILGVVGNIGKVMGGMSSILMGIGKTVLSAIAGLSGISTLVTMVSSILEDGVKPLNKIFKQIIGVVRPIVNTLKTYVKQIFDVVADIGVTIVKTIKPIMEFIKPLLDEVFTSILKPILDIVKTLTEVIMVPMLAAIKIMLPIIKTATSYIQTIAGGIEFLGGYLMKGIGGIIQAIGWIIRKLGGSSAIEDNGKNLVQQGDTMVDTGVSTFKEGVSGMIQGVVDTFTVKGLRDSNYGIEEKVTTEADFSNATIGEPGAELSGNGDVYNNNNSRSISNVYNYNNIYGSGNYSMNQGNYTDMNMRKHGCGPVALADAYARRTGKSINPALLAMNMAVGNGDYDSSHGTPVSGFIKTARVLGMGANIGGVTPNSLKNASPRNPITLLGSGSEFGTRRGNNHYVNVVGTDRFGGAYVANPLTGNVERRSLSGLAYGAKLGIYGSGFGDSNANKYWNLYGSGLTWEDWSVGVNDIGNAIKDLVSSGKDLVSNKDTSKLDTSNISKQDAYDIINKNKNTNNIKDVQFGSSDAPNYTINFGDTAANSQKTQAQKELLNNYLTNLPEKYKIDKSSSTSEKKVKAISSLDLNLFKNNMKVELSKSENSNNLKSILSKSSNAGGYGFKSKFLANGGTAAEFEAICNGTSGISYSLWCNTMGLTPHTTAADESYKNFVEKLRSAGLNNAFKYYALLYSAASKDYKTYKDYIESAFEYEEDKSSNTTTDDDDSYDDSYISGNSSDSMLQANSDWGNEMLKWVAPESTVDRTSSSDIIKAYSNRANDESSADSLSAVNSNLAASVKDFYSLGDEVNDAFAGLKELAARMTSMFTGNSTAEAAQASVDTMVNADKAAKVRSALGSEYAEYEEKAKELYMQDNPKRDGETDEAYKNRIEKYFYKSNTLNTYLVKAGADRAAEKMMSTYQSYEDSMFDMLDSSKDMSNRFSKLDASEGFQLSGSFDSLSGAVMAPYSPIDITETNITSSTSGNSPVHDFFAKTAGAKQTFSGPGNWFEKRNSPNKEGQGSSGDSHSGVDIWWPEYTEGRELHAITGGIVSDVWTVNDGDGSLGNSIKWKDDVGMYHWYMHMSDIAKDIKKNVVLKPGQLVGHAGNTGNSSGAHLHYTITKNKDGYSSDPGYVNPLTYWEYVKGATDTQVGNLTGDSTEEKVFNYLRSKGMSGIGAAGMMGCFKYESNFQTNNLENSYQSKWGYPSGEAGDKKYTSNVNSGVETEKQFVYGHSSGDQAGYGLPQFTSPDLKQGLYNKTVKKGISIDDTGAQLDEILTVLKNRNIYNSIKNASTPTEANKQFLWHYEAGQNYTSDAAVAAAYPWMGMSGINDRHQAAEKYYGLYKNNAVKSGSTIESVPVEGMFVSRIKNMAGNPTSVILSAAEVADALHRTDPNCTYQQYGKVLEFRDGSKQTGFRSDCSGYTGGIIYHMGYRFDKNGGTADWQKQLEIGTVTKANEMNFIYDQNGNVSKDWVLLDYSKDKLQRGDILYAGTYPSDHSDMFVGYNDAGLSRGFNMGGTNAIQAAMTNGANLLNGDSTWEQKLLNNGNAGSMPSSRTQGDIHKILRYVGKGSKLTGSGDVWEDTLFNNNPIPPLDIDKLQESIDGQNVQVVNNEYVITPNQTSSSDLLEKMSKMTFNVRAERVEKLLEELIEKTTGDKPTEPVIDNQPVYDPFEDDEQVPEAVVRLARG